MGTLKEINYGVGKYLEASDASDIPAIGNNRKNLDLLNFKVATNNAYTLYKFKDGFIDAYQDQTGVDLATSTGENYDNTDKVYTSKQSLVEYDYSYSGSTESLAVVTGTTYTIKTWGAGGGNGAQNEGGWQAGAAGGFSTGTYSFGTNTTLVIGVGGLGTKGNQGSAGGWPGGGPRGPFYNNTSGGANGGGYSGVFVGSQAHANTLQIAGGGGGGYYYGPHGGAVAGGGGGSSGTNSAGGSSGGTQSAGGTQSGGGSGSALQGGTGGNGADGIGGAGGGGGYYGGAGSGGYGNGGGSGGGGSGFVATTATINSVAVTAVSAGATTASVGTSMNGTGSGDPDYPGGVGNEQQNGAVYISYTPQDNMSLVSRGQTAQADPTLGRLMLYEQDIDSITLDTDIKGYVSRNGGSNWTQTLLTDDGFINTNRGIDSYTKLMLHCDGANAGTTFTDSSIIPKTVTRNQGTTVTAIKKFGTAAGYFDGSGTYPTGNLVVANDSDFDFTGDFTIDFWLYLPSNAASLKNQKILGCSLVSGSWVGWHIKKDNLNLRLNWEGSGFNTQFSSDVAVETWTHVAVVRSGTTTTGYLNGTSAMSLSQSGTVTSGSYDFAVGAEHNDANWDYPVMHIDEIRISKGIARWTSNFTAPDLPYNIADRILSGSVDISGQPSGTDMKYKVETLNNKSLNLHGASLLWA